MLLGRVREQDLDQGTAGCLGKYLDGWFAGRDLASFAGPLRQALFEGEVVVISYGLDEVPLTIFSGKVRGKPHVLAGQVAEPAPRVVTIWHVGDVKIAQWPAWRL